MKIFTDEELKEPKNMFTLIIHLEGVFGYVTNFYNDYIDVDDFTGLLYIK